MKISANGKLKEVEDSSNLEKLINELCRDTSSVIAELNGTIIHKEQWPHKSISEGDQINLFNFVGGG